MSVVIAVKENGIVYMGTDSQTSAGLDVQHNLNTTGYKIVRLDNGILLGVTGTVNSKHTALADPKIFTLDENERLTHKHVVTETVPHLIRMLEDIGDPDERTLNISLLLAHKDSIYKIDSDLKVTKYNSLAASGSGMLYVNYVMNERKDLPVRERLLKALNQSARRDPGVNAPFVFIDTEKLEYEVTDKEGNRIC